MGALLRFRGALSRRGQLLFMAGNGGERLGFGDPFEFVVLVEAHLRQVVVFYPRAQGVVVALEGARLEVVAAHGPGVFAVTDVGEGYDG